MQAEDKEGPNRGQTGAKRGPNGGQLEANWRPNDGQTRDKQGAKRGPEFEIAFKKMYGM